MRIEVLQAALLYLLLSSCAAQSAVPAEVRFCPDEDCLGLLVDALSGAERTIDCAFYDLSHDNVTAALLAAQARNVSVRLVLDRKNEVNDSAPYEFSRIAVSSGLMHHKFCVIDGRHVTSGSMNPTERDAHVNRNNLVLFDSPLLAKQYGQEFEELWEGKWPGTASMVRRAGNVGVFFCPEDSCRDAVIREVRDADAEIRVIAFSFTDDALGTELILAHYRNVSVRALFDVRQNIQYSQLPRLALQGIETRIYAGKGFLHHKVWLIDNSTVITGSFNPSANAIRSNEENLLVIKDGTLASRYIDEFESLWKMNT